MNGPAGWTTWHAPGLVDTLARTPVVVLFGGRSSEREVSLVSGREMVAAISSREAEPQRDVALPRVAIGVEIASDGRWIVDGMAIPPERALERLPDDALFLLGLHGGEGEDGRLQGFFDVTGRRYTGSGAAASSFCMDKHHSRVAFAAAGLPIAPGALVRVSDWRITGTRALQPALTTVPGPWFVKPRFGGSSVLTFPVAEALELGDAVGRVIDGCGEDALVESAIDGIEVTCGVIGNQGEQPVALPLVEILPKEGHFFDYEEKYSESGAIEVCPPEHITEATARHVAEIAVLAYVEAGCDGYARVDFIVRESGEPVLLEINTLPGFTPRSLLPQEAAATGVGFRELCLELCALAIDRFRKEGA